MENFTFFPWNSTGYETWTAILQDRQKWHYFGTEQVDEPHFGKNANAAKPLVECSCHMLIIIGYIAKRCEAIIQVLFAEILSECCFRSTNDGKCDFCCAEDGLKFCGLWTAKLADIRASETLGDPVMRGLVDRLHNKSSATARDGRLWRSNFIRVAKKPWMRSVVTENK